MGILTAGFVLLSGLYVAALAVYIGHFVNGEAWQRSLSRVLITVLIGVHALLLVGIGFAYRELPLISKENVFSMLALSLAVVYRILEIRFKVKATGAFVILAAAVFHLLSWPQVSAQPKIVPILQNPFFGVHVVLAILGYTSFVVSVVYGGLYLALFRAIKEKKFGLVFQRMPALDLLSRMNAHAAITGFGFLSVSMALGVLLSLHLKVRFLTDPTFIQSLVTWVGYGAFVAVYHGLRWRGLRQVYCSMGSFALLLCSVAAVLLAFQSFHTFN